MILIFYFYQISLNVCLCLFLLLNFYDKYFYLVFIEQVKLFGFLRDIQRGVCWEELEEMQFMWLYKEVKEKLVFCIFFLEE